MTAWFLFVLFPSFGFSIDVLKNSFKTPLNTSPFPDVFQKQIIHWILFQGISCGFTKPFSGNLSPWASCLFWDTSCLSEILLALQKCELGWSRESEGECEWAGQGIQTSPGLDWGLRVGISPILVFPFPLSVFDNMGKCASDIKVVTELAFSWRACHKIREMTHRLWKCLNYIWDLNFLYALSLGQFHWYKLLSISKTYSPLYSIWLKWWLFKKKSRGYMDRKKKD